MRFGLILALTLATSAAYADSVKIGTKPYDRGTTLVHDKSSEIKGTVEAKGQQLPLLISNVEKQTIEVLEVKADVITKEKVTYTKRSRSETIGGKDRPHADPLDGKTYTLTAGEPITVEPATDADAVRKAESRFGKPDNVRRAVGGHEYTKGKPVDIAATAGSGVFGDDSDVTKFELEYTGMDGKNAKFNLHAVATTKGTPAMVIDLSGPVIVDPSNAEALSMKLTGTIKSVGAPKIEGTMTMSSVTTVKRP